jgi:hypothetical protein
VLGVGAAGAGSVLLSAASLAAIAAAFFLRSSIIACVNGADVVCALGSGWKDGPASAFMAPASWKSEAAGANRGSGAARSDGVWAGVNEGPPWSAEGVLGGCATCVDLWDMANRRRYASSPVSGMGVIGLLVCIDESS